MAKTIVELLFLSVNVKSQKIMKTTTAVMGLALLATIKVIIVLALLATININNVNAQPAVMSLSHNHGECWQKVSVATLKDVGAGDFIQPAAGVTDVTLLFAVCPNNAADLTAVWAPWRSSTMSFWDTDILPTNGVSLTVYFPITVGSWKYMAVNPAATVPMSLGVLTSVSDPQRGNRIACSFRVKGGPISLERMSLTISDGNLIAYKMSVTNHSKEYVGYGNIGQEVTSGPATQWLYGLKTAGPAVGFAAASQNDLNVIRDWVGSNYLLTATLDITNVMGQWAAHLTRKLSFAGSAASLSISRPGRVEITGRDSQLYYLESTTALCGGSTVWTLVGPPAVAGSTVQLGGSTPAKFFRARQGQ
ncbi:MAG: hypothetical protein PHS62_05360 [Patescibacteria group bacterium]|nr:hypothetical protein [Patescibacteria group bacterium]